jgi:hypothetical protein
MKILSILALLLTSASAQDQACFQGTDVDQGPPLHYMRAIPCDTVPIIPGNVHRGSDWTVIPEETPKHHWYNWFGEHPVKTGSGVGALIGTGIAWEHMHFCHAYENGNNGVGLTHCPHGSR